MELKVGYKQTEIGLIPTDWSVRKFGDVIERVVDNRGKTPPLSSFGFPLIEVNSIYKQGKSPNLSLVSKFVSSETYQNWFRNGHPKLGDTLVVTVGSAGATSYVSEEIGCIAQNIISLRFNDEISSLYCYYYSKTRLFSRSVDAVLMGGVQPSLKVPHLRTFLLPVPNSKIEQTAIANALSDADALIGSLQKLIAKKRQIKQGAMQTLLVGKNRPAKFVKSSAYKNTEIGQIPEDWDCIAMGEIGQPIIGLTYSPKDVRNYGTLVLRSSNVQDGKLAYENNVFVEMDLPSRVMVEQGDILICVRNGSRQLIGKCALIDETAKGAAFGAFMSIFRSKFSKFIFYQFQSNIIQRQIDEVMGATINQLTNRDLSVFKIAMPRDELEQSHIVSILSDMDAEIAALEEKLVKYQQIKQGMMQNLLTGRIRLV